MLAYGPPPQHPYAPPGSYPQLGGSQQPSLSSNPVAYARNKAQKLVQGQWTYLISAALRLMVPDDDLYTFFMNSLD